MTIMEDTVNVLEPGSIVKCKIMHDKELFGEVLSWDYENKAIIISCKPPSNSSQQHHDIHLINMNRVGSCVVLQKPKENQAASLPVSSLDNTKLLKRQRDNVNQKLTLVHSIGVGVTPEAQALFNCIKKTYEDVKWEGNVIKVMNEITITEPYTVDDITTTGRQSGLDHIRKIVQKHYDDKRKPSQTN